MEKKVVSTEEDHFYANACHVCGAYGKDIELKRCASCKMIAYCSREHQKEHWQHHKKMCKIISKLRINSDSLFQSPPRWKNREYTWTEGRTWLVCIIRATAKDPNLLTYEEEMILFPRACEICHETDPLKLEDCKDCPDASFCLQHPKDGKHSAKCIKSKLHFEANNASAAFEDILLTKNYSRNIPKNMNEAINLFASQCHVDETFTSSKSWAAILSSRLTQPYTFMHSMDKLSHPKLQQMTIHVLVTDSDAVAHPNYWHCLLHHDDTLRELKIICIGPQLCKDLEEMQHSPRSVEIQLCDNCIENNRQINIQTVGDSYTNFAAGEFFTKPDYVIGFQLKIAKWDELWYPTVTKLAELACPFVVASASAEASQADQERIDLILGKKVLSFWAGKNPFPDWRPFKDRTSADFYYDNEYLTIYEKLS